MDFALLLEERNQSTERETHIRYSQNFKTDKRNQIWCTDFTYLFLSNGVIRYNCTIIDLYDRSVIASLNGDHITAELAIETVKIAIKRHKPGKGLILHSDQGRQFTSKEFSDFCKKKNIQQSMSRAGCHTIMLQWNDTTIR